MVFSLKYDIMVTVQIEVNPFADQPGASRCWRCEHGRTDRQRLRMRKGGLCYRNDGEGKIFERVSY